MADSLPYGRLVSRAASLGLQTLSGKQPPRFLTHIVTFRCNARCLMCDSWTRDGREDLDLSAIEAVYRKLPPMDGVRLTGGEPFVRTDFAEIAAAAQRILKPLFLHVTTNGFLTTRIVDFCRTRDRSIPLHLMVSLDGLQDEHDRIRGKDGAHSMATRTLQSLAPMARELNLKLAVNQTVVDRNGIVAASRLREYLSDLGVAHQIVLAYESSGTYSEDWDDDSAKRQIGTFSPLAKLEPDEIEALLREMEASELGADYFTRTTKAFYRNGLRERLTGQNTTPLPCAALGRHLRLYPDGSVPVCQFNPAKAGNLVRQNLSELLESPRAKEWKAWVDACPGCWAECEVLPSAIYSGALFRKDQASAPHPANISKPPTGVKAPNQRVPVSERA
ncbi:MAG: Cyclic pyranopterin monophosphate synthase [Fibrobacterota bacterium]|jgi:MoaA/NifB/PqqE/SkfB family radical SAM enzyme